MDKTFSKFIKTFTDATQDENSTIFMTQLLEFVERLRMVFRKYDTQLTQAHTYLSLALGNGNAPDLIQTFVESVGPYKHAIATEDESQIDEIAKLPLVALLNIDLKDDWSKLSARTKKVIWQYLQQLLCTAYKCANLSKAFSVLRDKKTLDNLLHSASQMNEQFVKDFGHEIDTNNKADIDELARRLQVEMDSNRLEIATTIKGAIAQK